MSFRHSFRHWFNVCWSNLNAWNAKKMSIMAVFCVFKYKMVSKGYAGYGIPDAKCETSFRHSFRHLFNFFRGNLQDQKCKKWSFMPIYDVFKYRWHLIEMPDNAYQMRDVRWVSGIFSGIDLIFSGAIYMTRNAKNNHLCQFLTYLRTRITINFIKKESHK